MRDPTRQQRRDAIGELLTKYGHKSTLEALTGFVFNPYGHVILMSNNKEASELLPHLDPMEQELKFHERMKYISINGRPPEPRHPPEMAGEAATPPPELIELLGKLMTPTPKKTRPKATSTQTELFKPKG